MATSYQDRITIHHDGNPDFNLFTESGLCIAIGYERIVFGGRGPYVEFKKSHIVKKNFYIPEEVKWKMEEEFRGKVYYYELRTTEDNVKIYYQKKTVDYADYKIGMLYISPFDLYDDNGIVLIEPLRKRK